MLWVFDGKNGNHGELAYIEKDDVSNYRMDVTFKSAMTSLRLLMFQVFFMKYAGKPNGKTHKEILENYSFSYGFAPPGIPKKLQQGIFFIIFFIFLFFF